MLPRCAAHREQRGDSERSRWPACHYAQACPETGPKAVHASGAPCSYGQLHVPPLHKLPPHISASAPALLCLLGLRPVIKGDQLVSVHLGLPDWVLGSRQSRASRDEGGTLF